jgi:hypothetical protein
MGYIGQPLNAGNLAVQTGTGDGADTTPIATLDYSVGSSESLAIYLDGVKQAVATYTASGTTLTFTTAPPNGVGIEVVFLALPISLPTPGDSTVTNAKVAAGAAIATTKLGAGAIVQRVNTQPGTSTTGTTVLPFDDTALPQNTEGDEYMTLAVTPTNSSNILEIRVVFFGANSAAGNLSVCLFQDSTAGAIAASAYNHGDSSMTNIGEVIGWKLTINQECQRRVE